jgi:hypothetical protein
MVEIQSFFDSRQWFVVHCIEGAWEQSAEEDIET